MTFLYYVLKKCAEVVRKLYFRKVFVVGTANIPEDGPLIICGNHANQFIDPVMIASYCNREISFTMAASSFIKPIVGTIAKSINAIPVKRPEDYKVKGSGKIIINNVHVQGIETKFKDDIMKFECGANILVDGKFLTIKKVLSDILIEIVEPKEPLEFLDKEYEYSVRDHSLFNMISLFLNLITHSCSTKLIRFSIIMVAYAYFQKGLLMTELIFLN